MPTTCGVLGDADLFGQPLPHFDHGRRVEKPSISFPVWNVAARRATAEKNLGTVVDPALSPARDVLFRQVCRRFPHETTSGHLTGQSEPVEFAKISRQTTSEGIRIMRRLIRNQFPMGSQKDDQDACWGELSNSALRRGRVRFVPFVHQGCRMRRNGSSPRVPAGGQRESLVAGA